MLIRANRYKRVVFFSFLFYKYFSIFEHRAAAGALLAGSGFCAPDDRNGVGYMQHGNMEPACHDMDMFFFLVRHNVEVQGGGSHA